MDRTEGPFDWDGNNWGHVYLIDGRGRRVATIYGKLEAKVELVKRIVQALNNEDGVIVHRQEKPNG